MNPYPVIWLHIARLHAHDQDDDEFAANAAKLRRDAWPSTVVDLYLGASNAEQIVSAALAAKDATGKHACEADFFIGDYEGHRGDSMNSQELLKRVVTKCRAFDTVYSAAQSELQIAGWFKRASCCRNELAALARDCQASRGPCCLIVFLNIYLLRRPVLLAIVFN